MIQVPIMAQQSDTATAWNPGLQSDIPSRLWPLVTVFREENAFVSYALAKELSDLTGLKPLDLIALRAERLVTHALLVRVTADLSVADGPSYEELGLNLRGMVEKINARHMRPKLPVFDQSLAVAKAKAHAFALHQLTLCLNEQEKTDTARSEKKPLLQRWFGKAPAPAARSANTDESPEISAINKWKQASLELETGLEKACFDALAKTVDSIVGHRGRMIPDHDLVATIVCNQVGNTHGAQLIDTLIDDIWHDAVGKEKFRALPAQSLPVIMNVKGASASGKSTIRPRQRELAGKLGIPWEDFALISPDYWRKYLLDYESLGEDYKYGAMLTGRELEIIDRKLDRYMAAKAAKGEMSHLLIDRFRFDSFTVDTDRTADSKLLSRFGDQVYLFFMITNPAETVARAWSRGLKTGRYKAVDDLLYHNVEAFTGMPSLFLSWVNSRDKRIHFEFLDNDVAEGQLPKTAAFGWNNSMTILDIQLFLNIDRFKRVNIAATQSDEIFSAADLAVACNHEFITQCVQTVSEVRFADQDTAQVYAVTREGQLVWWDNVYIEEHGQREGLVETLNALGYKGLPMTVPVEAQPEPIKVEDEQRVTVGRWAQ
jgi:hypothetical protein